MSSGSATTPGQAMEGGGFYNRHSALQASGIALLRDLWTETVRTVPFGDEPLVVVDYASSQGKNSMEPMRTAIEVLRSRAGPDRPIEVIHTDLPENDFSSLFTAIQTDPASYLAGVQKVFPAAIGRSYFDQILVPNRAHLGWNAWSMQWMSKLPTEVPDHVLAGMTNLPDAMKLVTRQLAADWRRYLELRSLELRPGGKLLVAYTGRTGSETGWERPLGELWASLCDMARDGMLRDNELERITIPIGLRTIDDVRAPFSGGNTFGGLHLDYAEILKTADPFWSEFEESKNAHQLGQRRADSMRAWAGPTIARLFDPQRDQLALADELFARFARRMSMHPEKHEPYMLAVVVTKT
jgi:hypothetical protein